MNKLIIAIMLMVLLSTPILASGMNDGDWDTSEFFPTSFEVSFNATNKNVTAWRFKLREPSCTIDIYDVYIKECFERDEIIIKGKSELVSIYKTTLNNITCYNGEYYETLYSHHFNTRQIPCAVLFYEHEFIYEELPHSLECDKECEKLKIKSVKYQNLIEKYEKKLQYVLEKLELYKK